MDCPKCDGTLRHFDTQEGIMIDLCVHCKGIWYDKGELGFQQELEGDFPDGARALLARKPTSYACPRCGPASELEELRYSAEHNLLVDRCPKCEGVFLDRGELRKIEFLASQAQPFATRMTRAMKDLEARGFTVLMKKKI